MVSLAWAGDFRGPFEPAWKSLKTHYRISRWFQDGKFDFYMLSRQPDPEGTMRSEALRGRNGVFPSPQDSLGWKSDTPGDVPCSTAFAFRIIGAGTEGKRIVFDFGPGRLRAGAIRILPTTMYAQGLGYGFEEGFEVQGVDRKGKDALRSDFCTGEKAFAFSVRLPEGNYDVTVFLGDLEGESDNAIKAESRRLMLENLSTRRGQVISRTFTVNIRTPCITSGGEVRLNAREQGVLHWDDKLTLEFNGKRPCVCGLEIRRAEKAVTIYIAGNSTVTDQTREPWAAWGQMLPRFFKAGAAVANHAESGESLKGFFAQRRFDKIFSAIKPGDYLFVEFGHNDQKSGPAHADAFTEYKDLLGRVVDETRRRGAVPVLVTPLHRRNFDSTGTVMNTLGDYPEAVRRAAAEKKTALIDLNAMSKAFYEALGPEASKRAFVHYPAGTFPDQPGELKDNTHFNPYGAYELAKCVVAGIRSAGLGIAKYLTNDVPPFDPARPDPVDSWTWPASPYTPIVKPSGN